jgi:UDP-glucose 4-epimerase
MEIHGDGLQTRTFTYVTDTADGIIRALERPDSRGEVINLGGTETVTIQRLAELVQEKLGFQTSPLRARYVTYESLPGKYQDVIHRVPNTAKAERLLGFKATVGLEEGLDRTIAWHRDVRASGTAAQA